MNQHQRLKLLESQNRAFNEGTIEYINDQWVFFDDETEEASLLEDFDGQQMKVFHLNKWRDGILIEDFLVLSTNEKIPLQDQGRIKIKKRLGYSFEKLLDDVNYDAFVQFVTTLNSLRFSIFDCIYCYNQLTFFESGNLKAGVNFIIFDNQEKICNVQHHFSYFKDRQDDRFEFTLNTGKRMVIEKIS